MPVVTRSQQIVMEDQMNRLFGVLAEMKTGQEGIGKSQDEMKTCMESLRQEIDEKIDTRVNEIEENVVRLRSDIEAQIADLRNQVEQQRSGGQLSGGHPSGGNPSGEQPSGGHPSGEQPSGEQQGHNEHGHRAVQRPQGFESPMREATTSGSARMKPPTFDGETPWSTYLKQFEAAASVNQWGDREKAIALIIALRGDALNVLMAIAEPQQQDYQALVKHLDMRYGDRHLQHVYQVQLKARFQNTGETVQQFESDVARLVRQAYPTAPDDFLQQLAVQSFIDGLRDCETQQALRLARHKELGEVLAHALEFEAAKQASQGHLKVRQLQTLGEVPKDLVEELREKIKNLESQLHSQGGLERNGRRPVRCWACGERGHLSRQCKSPAGSQPQDAGVFNQRTEN
jgi:Zinc knuckle